MITPNVNSVRGIGDKVYFSISDTDTIEEAKEIVKELKAKGDKPLYKHLKARSGGKSLYRVYVLKEVSLTESEIEFLTQSNKIEREESIDALKDSMYAFQYAKERGKEMNLDYILFIHQLVMRRLNKTIAGKWRNCSVRIGYELLSKEKKYFIRKKVQEWLDSCQPTKLGIEEDIRRWHIAFEKIHPFNDGNGRVGRILMNVQRLKYNLPILTIHTGEEQQNYYGWFIEEFKTSVCQRCGEVTTSNNKYCNSCYNTSVCKSCGRKSYGKPYCLYCFNRGIKRRR